VRSERDRQALPRVRDEILYTKRTRLTEDEERALGVQWVDGKDEIIRRSDYVCLIGQVHAGDALDVR